MSMIEDIKKSIAEASSRGQKMAMFHFQVLLNATALEGVDPEDFCREVSVPASYKTEFRKMLSVARVMRQHGLHIS